MTDFLEIQTFWGKIAKQYIDWQTPWQTITQGNFEQGNVQWFVEGELNASVNCLDRHLARHGDKPAIIWVGDNPDETITLSFTILHQEVCRMANVLKLLGIKKGMAVAIYLPMIPEAIISMLACARIGAVHTVVFAGFSSTALKQRLEDANCQLVITADGYQRGGKSFALKTQADEACEHLALTKLVIKHNNSAITMNPSTDYWWHDLREPAAINCPPERMKAEDPLFILYTSGSTGKPKGLVHSTGGYLVQAAFSHQHSFDCHQDDVFWCTADVGWITGHTYLVYGPLCNGTTTLMFAGIPTWPDASRCWQIIDKHQVNVFYTAPTAIRAMKRAGDQWLASSSRQSLRLLGSVGEPISPEVWTWYQQQVGLNRVPVIDTWWQTETGAIMLCPQKTAQKAKPGSAGQPLPGIVPVVLDEQGIEISDSHDGNLALKYPWPAMARTIVGDHPRYRSSYFKQGYYLTGDGAYRDVDGDYWLLGRIDDVLNVSGHRLGTAEIESALITHPSIAEAAVVGIPDEQKGQGIYAWVSLKQGYTFTDAMKEQLITAVKQAIGAIAKPDHIQCVSDLPKTRSGKIMRRLLRIIASKQVTQLDELGDVSTLANPHVIEELLASIDEK